MIKPLMKRVAALLIGLAAAWLASPAQAYDPVPPSASTRPFDARLPNGVVMEIPRAGLDFVALQLESGLQGTSLRTTIAEALEGQYFEILLPIFGGNLRLTIPCGEESIYKSDSYFDRNYGTLRAWCPFVRGDAVRDDQGALDPVTAGSDRGFRYQKVTVDVSTYPIKNLTLPRPNSLFGALNLLEGGGKRAQLDVIPEHPLFKVNVPIIDPANPGQVSYVCFNILGNGAGCQTNFVVTIEADLVTGGELRPFFEDNTLFVLVTNFNTRLQDLEILTPLTQNTALMGALDACVNTAGPLAAGCAQQRDQLVTLYTVLEQAIGDAVMQLFERELNAALSEVLQDGINQLMFDRAKDGTPDPVISLNGLADKLTVSAGVPLAFNFDARYQSNATDPATAFFVMDGGMYAGAFSTCVNPGADPSFFYTLLEQDGNAGHDAPRLGAVIPGTNVPYQIGVAVSDDLINQIVYNVWAAGLICATLSPHDKAVPREVADLLTTDSFAPFVRWLPEIAPHAPVVLRLTPRSAPYVTFGDVGDDSLFRINMPNLLLDVFVERGGADKRLLRAFSLSAAITAAVDVKGINFSKAPLIDLNVSFVSASGVAFNDLHPEHDDELLRLLEPVLDAMAPSLADAVGNLEVPILSDCIGGLRQRDLVMRTSGRDPVSGLDNYLELYLNFSGFLDFNKIINECVFSLEAPPPMRAPADWGLIGTNPAPIDAAAAGVDTARPFRWRIDRGFWRTAAGPLAPRLLLDGRHRVEFEQAGRRYAAGFELDSAAPIVRFTQAAGVVTVETVDIGRVYTRIDGGNWSTGVRRELVLAPGRHTLRVEARDAAGHESAVTRTLVVAPPAGGCASGGAPAAWAVFLLVSFLIRKVQRHEHS
jgi:hypothetical protein